SAAQVDLHLLVGRPLRRRGRWLGSAQLLEHFAKLADLLNEPLRLITRDRILRGNGRGCTKRQRQGEDHEG
ncbi:MAG: hypothetical protein DMD89_03485, partial [Candidatus Rokuibacteriota bacterium]